MKKPIQRSIVLRSMVFLLALVVLLSVISYYLLSSSVYTRYDTKLRDVITYVEKNADADDLAECARTGQHSPHYDQLQLMLNEIVDDFELEYLYIVIPSEEVMTNLISATSAEERAAGEDDMALLETTDAYSTDELRRYLSYWDTDGVSYFSETSGYGEFYTAVKALRDSNGDTVALICADLSVSELRASLLALFGTSVLVVVVILGAFAAFATRWVNNNVTKPLEELEQSTREFAEESHDLHGVAALEYKAPVIETENEVQSLGEAIAKMADDIQSHVDEALAAQARAAQVERENERLAGEAAASARIAELSQSVTSLLINMPGLSFSKDADTGVYLACNQAFAEYAHKADPSGVIGLTDHEIFDPVTAQHFVEDDVKALSMDEPYVFFEDVFDAVGNPRQFQTTKMKYYDTKGRLCTLGMCADVTDLYSARRDAEEALRAYEEAREARNAYFSIVRALSADYMRLYSVDLETGHFVTYRHEGEEGSLSVSHEGDDFFEAAKNDALQQLYAEDKAAFVEAFNEENVMRTIKERDVFTLSYRVMVDGAPRYMGLKASLLEDDRAHLVVGVSDIDAQAKSQEAARRVREEQLTFARITALSGDYLAIYAVDPETGHYEEYRTSDVVGETISLHEGDDFFGDALANCERVVHRDDFSMVQNIFIREKVVDEARSNGVFAMTFRIVVREEPIYVSLRAALVNENDGTKLIVGISNVDSQMRREREFNAAQDRATRDGLTGVKNKFAYADAEAALNQEIAAGSVEPFGIVVCDVNDLKLENDTKGHQAGDALIREACAAICGVFEHSPVFRIGGDEFAVILQGGDYARRADLVAKLDAINEGNGPDSGAIVAWGASIFSADPNVAAVFRRADAAMYERKRMQKGR